MWTDGVAFEQFGVRIGIRTDSRDLADLAESRLPPGSAPLASERIDVLFSLTGGGASRRGLRRFALLYEGISVRLRTLDREVLADALDSAIHVALAERATEWLFVHAGVVGWRGRAILLPGATLSGKTTLVAALLRAGADYYSDDRAVIDRLGRVHPHSRPLSIRDSPVARQRPITPASFGASTGTGSLPVGLIAFATFREGASWAPRRMSPGRAVLALLGHASAVRLRPDAVVQLLRRTVAEASAYHGMRGDASETAERLLALAESNSLDMQGRRSSPTDDGLAASDNRGAWIGTLT